MKSLVEIINTYFQQKGQVKPCADDVINVLKNDVSILGFLHPDERAGRFIKDQIGRVMFALMVYAIARDIDPVGAMLEYLYADGYEPKDLSK